MSSLLLWFFLIPAIGIAVLAVLVPVLVTWTVRDRRRRAAPVEPPVVSDDGRFYWTGSRWKPLA